MNILRRITVAVFALVLCLFSFFYWKERKNKDDTWPVIDLPQEELLVSNDVTNQDMLHDVTAHDGKDGDLTDKIILESVSKFIRPGICKATYAVVDSDNHVAKAERVIHYEDYQSPRFFLKMPAYFYEDDDINVREQIGAIDCLDGDISDRVTVTSTQRASASSDTFLLSVQVTNSHGDKVYLDLPVYVSEGKERDAEIQLSEPLIYVEKGKTPNFKAYVSGVTLNEEPLKVARVTTASNFNPDVPGVYSVHIDAVAEGHNAHTVLTVIVEE